MRIRRMALILASDHQDDICSSQEREEGTMRDEKKNNVVDDEIFTMKDDGPPPQERKDGTMRDEKKKKNVVDETLAMKDDATPAQEREEGIMWDEKKKNAVDEPLVMKDDASLPQEREDDTLRNEKKKNVVDETFSILDDDHREAKPIGDVVRVSGEGMTKRDHFASFEYDDVRYDIEDSAMFLADGKNKRPYVGIIKDIFQIRDGSMIVTVQWFYRPEDTHKRGGGNWESHDTRELFYSFHQDEIPVESIMHKCVVHFIPWGKQIPHRKQYPGFIIQKVYDTEQRKLFKFTEVYAKNIREEIDLFVQKTMSQIGELPDIEKKDKLKKKRLLRKKVNRASRIF